MADAPTREISTQVASRLPMPKVANTFGIQPESWKVLTEAIFPSARTPEAVVLALAYCKSRKLDIFKRPVHIVPIWDSKRKCEVETIWPGIGELRTTAARTGEYAGKEDTVFGPDITKTFKDDKGEVKVTFPEWAQVTGYRIVKGEKCKFVGPKVYWLETYATYGGSDTPNSMWQTRSHGQLDKCAEAAFLRVGFPEEIGNDIAAEEVGGRRGAEIIKDARTGAPVDNDMPREIDAAPQEEATKRETPPPADKKAPKSEEPAPTETVNFYKGAVVEVLETKTAKNPKYGIKGSDGLIYATFHKSLWELAKECHSTGEHVVIQWKPGPHGRDIIEKNMIRASEAEFEPGSDG